MQKISIKYVWMFWLFAMNPLGSAEIPSYHLMGEPNEMVACRYDVEDVNCSPVILNKERIIKRRMK
jgi:hypothetical protein